MPPSTIQKHKNIIAIIGAGLFVILLLLYYAPYGCHDYLVLRENLAQIKAEIIELKTKNQELNDEISLLKNDSNYVEKIARQKLGMLKKNEIVFEMPEKKTNKE